MVMDVDQAAKAMRDEEIEAEIEDFLEGFNQPHLPRHAGQCSGVLTSWYRATSAPRWCYRCVVTLNHCPASPPMRLAIRFRTQQELASITV